MVIGLHETYVTIRFDIKIVRSPSKDWDSERTEDVQHNVERTQRGRQKKARVSLISKALVKVTGCSTQLTLWEVG